MRIAAGVDVGSTQTKAVLMADNGARTILARAIVDTGANVRKAAENAFLMVCHQAECATAEVGFVVGTGYGRYNISFGNTQMTEISCHARGAHWMCPTTRTVIDMGGQDSKAIAVGADGQVLDFVMNDKCAAGTGRFLANAADVMGVELDEVGPLSLKATRPVRIATVCTVFVESDILSYLTQGKKPEDILGGVHLAIAKRTLSLARRVPLEPDIVMTGGVARNVGMVSALEEVLGAKLKISPLAQFTGAIGAAVFALEKMDDSFESLRGGPNMRLVAGIDCGSGFAKAVIMESPEPIGSTVTGDCQRPPTHDFAILGKGRVKSGVNMDEAAQGALERALQDGGLKREQIRYIATTGFGRYGVGFRDIQITEITSGARGAFYLFPNSRCVLDIGSQSTRAITMNDAGKVRAFKTNDKCAAGSGSFIVRAAKYLEIPLEQVGGLSVQATNPQPISSICAVLAESEIINHVSAGITVDNILRGIHDSLAERGVGMLKRVGMGGEVTFIGGVARQEGLVKALQEKLGAGVTVNVPADCEYVCALGAALLGQQRLAKAKELRGLAAAN